MCLEDLANESARVLAQSSRESEEVDKDLVEIDRLDAVQNLLKYQEETRRWRNKKVSLKDIKVGDFVLKRKKNADVVGKFQFAWEGPYCRCLNLSTSMGGTRSKVEGEDRHDLELEGLHEDTRHEIYTGSGS
jgi:hypothetical protein